MRLLFVGNPPRGGDQKSFNDWVAKCMAEIAQASSEAAETVADSYTIANLTELRTLDCATATLGDVRNVLGTFLNDLKKRGVNRADV